MPATGIILTPIGHNILCPINEANEAVSGTRREKNAGGERVVISSRIGAIKHFDVSAGSIRGVSGR